MSDNIRRQWIQDLIDHYRIKYPGAKEHCYWSWANMTLDCSLAEMNDYLSS